MARVDDAFREWSKIPAAKMNDALAIILRTAFDGGYQLGYEAKTAELNEAWDRAHESRGDE